MRKALLMRLSIRRVWAMRHQTGEQYSTAKWIKTRVVVQSIVASARQLAAAHCLKSPTEMLTSCAVTLTVDEM